MLVGLRLIAGALNWDTRSPYRLSQHYLRIDLDSVWNCHNDLLIKTAALMDRSTRSKEFAGTLESLRTKFRAKRDLQKLLGQKKVLVPNRVGEVVSL